MIVSGGDGVGVVGVCMESSWDSIVGVSRPVGGREKAKACCTATAYIHLLAVAPVRSASAGIQDTYSPALMGFVANTPMPPPKLGSGMAVIDSVSTGDAAVTPLFAGYTGLGSTSATAWIRVRISIAFWASSAKVGVVNMVVVVVGGGTILGLGRRWGSAASRGCGALLVVL